MQSMAEHYFQQGIEQGREQSKEHYLQQGIEQGREQGIEQGEHQMSIESTLNILTERFSNVDADALKPKLEAITDLNLLKQLNVNAAITESLNAFQEALNTD